MVRTLLVPPDTLLSTPTSVMSNREEMILRQSVTFCYISSREYCHGKDFPEERSKKNTQILRKKKKEVSVDELCLDQPDEFKEFMHYCRGLSFTQDPDYGYIIGLFEGCMKKNGFSTTKPDFIW
jgi:hypothetical protein